MVTSTNELEILRTESKRLGSRITRLSIILIGVLTIVTFTITNALDKVDKSGVKQERDRTEQLRNILVDRDLKRLSESTSQPADVESEDEKKKEKESSEVELNKARSEATEAQVKYDTLLNDSFSINPSLLGSGFRIDLRS